MLIDSHCHVQFPAYDADRGDVVDRATRAGVAMVAVGTQISTSEAAIRLAEQYPRNISAAIGYHPGHVSSAWHHDRKEQVSGTREEFDAEKFLKLGAHESVVAIGECGLDYYRLPAGDAATSAMQEMAREKEKQKEIFLAQIEIAEKLKKALMIHCRPSKGTDDAYEDLLSLVLSRKLSVPRIVHFYVGSPDVTKKLVDAGFYFTFGGVITFAREYDEAINIIPADRILLETDAPYVAPEPYRGKRNEPVYIAEVARRMAVLKNVSREAMEQLIQKNTETVFSRRFSL
jgi:TatD DNase family protein